MKILLFGANGQVGRALTEHMKPSGNLVALGRRQADLSSPDTLSDIIHKHNPDVVINAAAYTAVDKAESEEMIAHTVNAIAPGVLAKAAKQAGAWFIHYSTDYVFDGEKAAPYTETDTPNPLNVYGRTKLEGERAVEATGGNHLIFRTSWVYSDHGDNFISKILSLAMERDHLSVIDDQIGSPTGANLIALVTNLAIRKIRTATSPPVGLFHLTASGETSWHNYARVIAAQAQKRNWPVKAGPDEVKAVPSETFPTAARRPKNSRLSTRKLKEAFQIELPFWEQSVLRTVDDLVTAKRKSKNQ